MYTRGLSFLLAGVCLCSGGTVCAGETLDMKGYTASYALNSADWRPKIHNSYGELRVMPNGKGGKRTCSEFTLMGADMQRVPRPKSFAAMTWRYDCNATPKWFIFQGLVTGGAAHLPFAFDPSGGWPSFILYPDRSAWFGGPVTLSQPLKAIKGAAVACPLSLKLIARKCIKIIRNGVVGAIPWAPLE